MNWRRGHGGAEEGLRRSHSYWSIEKLSMLSLFWKEKHILIEDCRSKNVPLTNSPRSAGTLCFPCRNMFNAAATTYKRETKIKTDQNHDLPHCVRRTGLCLDHNAFFLIASVAFWFYTVILETTDPHTNQASTWMEMKRGPQWRRVLLSLSEDAYGVSLPHP